MFHFKFSNLKFLTMTSSMQKSVGVLTYPRTNIVPLPPRGTCGLSAHSQGFIWGYGRRTVVGRCGPF